MASPFRKVVEGIFLIFALAGCSKIGSPPVSDAQHQGATYAEVGASVRSLVAPAPPGDGGSIPPPPPSGGDGGSIPVPLTSITLTPASSSIPKGLSQQFTAIGTYADGSTQNITSTATWSAGSPSVASLNSSGLVVGGGRGRRPSTFQSDRFLRMRASSR